MAKEYYSYPIQVVYYNRDVYGYIGGIAYQDVVICGCCGEAIKIQSIIETTPTDCPSIIEFDDWINIESVVRKGSTSYFPVILDKKN